MTIDEQITALLAQAEPLRALPAEDGEAAGLGKLVDQINWLRAQQDKVRISLITEARPSEEGSDAVSKPSPGRARKSEA